MPTKDFSISSCLPVINTGGSGSNPGDKHLPIGKWDPGTGLGWSTRVLVKASISFAGMSKINSATLRVSMHTASGWHAHGSGSVNVQTRRKTADWSESDGGSTATDETWGGSDIGSKVTGNITDDGDGSSSVSNGTADGGLETIGITEAVRAWYSGKANYGLMVRASNEDSSAEACEFYSRRESGEGPVIRIDYDTNTPPNAPTNLNPSGSEVVNSGRTPTYSGTRSDPDSGDGITAYQIQVRLDGGATIQDWTSGNPGGLPATFSKALTLPSGYDADRYYEWRARTRDQDSAWGAWSGWQRFRPNTVPDTPPAPNVDTDTLTPTITGEFVDPDANDGPAFVEIEVEQVSPSADVWLSGKLAIAASPWSKVYAGPALAWGTAYRARYRLTDTLGGLSAYGAWANFTPTQPIGPDNLSPRSTATKQNTTSPALTVGHSVAFRNDEIEVYAANSLTATRLWAKAKAGSDYTAATSKVYAYAGTALAWGGTYYWRARVEDATTGVDSAWSPLVPFYVNAEPGVPANLAARNAAGDATVLKDGVFLVTTLTPRVEAEYLDPDLGPYGDKPSNRTVEVYNRNADGSAGTLVDNSTLSSPPYTVPMAYNVPAAKLVLGSAYLVRWRFTDNAARVSPWSAYMQLRVTAAPTVTLVSPASNAVLTDQTPTLAWDFVSTSGKLQASYHVELFDRGPTAALFPAEERVFDSGVLSGTAEAFDIPAGIVLDDRSYRWQVTVTDTDGLSAVLA